MNRIWILIFLSTIGVFLILVSNMNVQRSSSNVLVALIQKEKNDNAITSDDIYSASVSETFNTMFDNDSSLQMGLV